MIYLVYATERGSKEEKLIGNFTRGHIAISWAHTFAKDPEWENVRVEIKPKE